MNLTVMPDILAVARLAPEAALPSWILWQEPFVSVTRTVDEISVVCADRDVPVGVLAERGYRCLKVDGPIPFSVTGVAAALTVPLAEAGVSVFVVATFDTDYLLVKDASLDAALTALCASGHTVRR